MFATKMLCVCFTKFSFPCDPFLLNEFHLIESDAATDKRSFCVWDSYPQEGIFSVTLNKMISIRPLVQLEFNLLDQLSLSCYLTLKKSNFPQDFIIPLYISSFFHWMSLINSWKRKAWVRAILHTVVAEIPFFSNPPLPTCLSPTSWHRMLSMAPFLLMPTYRVPLRKGQEDNGREWEKKGETERQRW